MYKPEAVAAELEDVNVVSKAIKQLASEALDGATRAAIFIFRGPQECCSGINPARVTSPRSLLSSASVARGCQALANLDSMRRRIKDLHAANGRQRRKGFLFTPSSILMYRQAFCLPWRLSSFLPMPIACLS